MAHNASHPRHRSRQSEGHELLPSTLTSQGMLAQRSLLQRRYRHCLVQYLRQALSRHQIRESLIDLQQRELGGEQCDGLRHALPQDSPSMISKLQRLHSCAYLHSQPFPEFRRSLLRRSDGYHLRVRRVVHMSHTPHESREVGGERRCARQRRSEQSDRSHR